MNNEKVEVLKTFLLTWALSQLSQSPSTNVDEVVLALRAAADFLESDRENLPEAFKKLLR